MFDNIGQVTSKISSQIKGLTNSYLFNGPNLASRVNRYIQSTKTGHTNYQRSTIVMRVIWPRKLTLLNSTLNTCIFKQKSGVLLAGIRLFSDSVLLVFA